MYQQLINGRQKVGTKNWKNPKVVIDYWQTIDDVCENLEDYNPAKKRRVLLVFDDMLADTESNKKIKSLVTELFLRGKEVNVSFAFISQSYIKCLNL